MCLFFFNKVEEERSEKTERRYIRINKREAKEGRRGKETRGRSYIILNKIRGRKGTNHIITGVNGVGRWRWEEGGKGGEKE